MWLKHFTKALLLLCYTRTLLDCSLINKTQTLRLEIRLSWIRLILFNLVILFKSEKNRRLSQFVHVVVRKTNDARIKLRPLSHNPIQIFNDIAGVHTRRAGYKAVSAGGLSQFGRLLLIFCAEESKKSFVLTTMLLTEVSSSLSIWFYYDSTFTRDLCALTDIPPTLKKT